jgi:choline dehydrogenase
VLLNGRRAIGVQARRGGRNCQVFADRVTLCAGAIATPTILLRSGIGDADSLRLTGIPPVIHLPGVGQNLIDHPAIVIWATPRPDVCRAGAPWHQVMARAASTGGSPDLHLYLLNNVQTASFPIATGLLDEQLAVAVSAMLLTPASRGVIRLNDARPDTKPVIDLRLASAPEDVDRLMCGARLAWGIVRSRAVADLLDRVVLWNDRIMSEDTLLRRAIMAFVSTTWHAAGSARMGPAADPMAVVDQYCRVHQVERLRVVDASVLPSLPSAPPNLTCIMLAERVAEWMSGGSDQ